MLNVVGLKFVVLLMVVGYLLASVDYYVCMAVLVLIAHRSGYSLGLLYVRSFSVLFVYLRGFAL